MVSTSSDCLACANDHEQRVARVDELEDLDRCEPCDANRVGFTAVATCSSRGLCEYASPPTGIHSCTSPSDCAVVNVGCCECGPQPTAVNVDHVDAFRASVCPDDATPTTCAECDPDERIAAACVHNNCVVVDRDEINFDGCLTASDCEIVPGCCRCDPLEAVRTEAVGLHNQTVCTDNPERICDETCSALPAARRECLEGRCVALTD